MNLARYQHRLPRFKNVAQEIPPLAAPCPALFAHKKDSPDSPPPRDLAAEIQQILSQGPAIYRSQRELSPQNLGLDLSNLNLALEGTPGRAAEGGYWVNSKTGERSSSKPKTNFFGMTEQGWQYVPPTAATPAQRGLKQIFSEDIQPQATRSATMAYNDLRGLNPGGSALFDELQSGALSDLKAGDRLTPDQIYRATQPVRADWASRGFGPGTLPEGLDETLQLYEGGQDLLTKRRAAAAGTLALGNDLYTLPAFQYGQQQGNQLLGLATGYGKGSGNVFGQIGGYGSDLFGSNQNQAYTDSVNRANTNNANTANTLGTIASLALFACWAAREVFGPEDHRWLQFRDWMLYEAPEKFRDWYLRNGMNWAARLKHASTGTRTAVQRWMERRIAHAL